MKKSVYSLVLMDEVVEAIDQLAYSVGTSRSNLINQILAERVALITPQKHRQNIFGTMAILLEDYQNFKVQEQVSDTLCHIRSVLKYKYNPTIRYTVSLNGQEGHALGELKVSSRTQSPILYEYLEGFFNMWSHFEREQGTISWQREEGTKWSRLLCPSESIKEYNTNQIAEAVSDYIKVIDEGLKIYFTSLDDLSTTTLKMYDLYKHYLKSQTIKI